MNMKSMSMYTDPTVNLANQILNVAICESQGAHFKAGSFFNYASNFELIVYLKDNYKEKEAKKYLEFLENKIDKQCLTVIKFE